MRNALLIGVGALVALGVLWLWAQPSAAPSSKPMAAAPPELPPHTGNLAAVGGRPAPALQPVVASAAELTERAREQLERDPAAALSAIERADELAGVEDERRRALEIDALVRLGRVGHARALTDRFYRAFPNSVEIRRLEQLTGYHPRPYGP